MIPELNKIYHGDCLEIMRSWPDKCVDLIVTSPPYNLGNNHHTGTKRHNPYDDNMDESRYQEWQIEVLRECSRVCSGDMFYNHQHRIKSGVLIKPDCFINKAIVWKQKQEIVWHRGSPNMDKCRFFPFTERIYWLSKNGSSTEFRNDGGFTDDWHLSPVGTGGDHTRAFPIEIPQRILNCIKEGIVLDPFSGSGTTAVAAERIGRKWIGIELEEKYCKIAQERVDAERAQGKLF